jgi:hypothetical protein
MRQGTTTHNTAVSLVCIFRPCFNLYETSRKLRKCKRGREKSLAPLFLFVLFPPLPSLLIDSSVNSQQSGAVKVAEEVKERRGVGKTFKPELTNHSMIIYLLFVWMGFYFSMWGKDGRHKKSLAGKLGSLQSYGNPDCSRLQFGKKAKKRPN